MLRYASLQQKVFMKSKEDADQRAIMQELMCHDSLQVQNTTPIFFDSVFRIIQKAGAMFVPEFQRQRPSVTSLETAKRKEPLRELGEISALLAPSQNGQDYQSTRLQLP
jgi:hypothetical protein